jgi:predicted dehydrogenase
MKKIKVGIIGTGFSAGSQFEALSRLPHVEVVAVAASNQEKAQKWAARFGIAKAYGNYQQLLDDQEVEVVHNCTPNHLHFPINKAALLAGKHVLSEKPLAINANESQELVELAKNSDRVCGVCFNYRHYPLVAEAKARIQNEGKVHFVYGGYVQDWLLHENDYSWRLNPEWNGPSRAIADIGSHWSDTVQYVLGQKIVEVFADLKTVHPVRFKPNSTYSTFGIKEDAEVEPISITTEDGGSVLIHFEDGTHGAFTISQVSAGRKNRLHFEISAQQSSMAWDQEQPNRLWIGKRDEANQELLRDPSLLSEKAAVLAHYPGGHQEGWPDGLKNLFADFYQAVSNRKVGEPITPSFATFEDGHYIMKLIEAILKSHQTKSWVRV